MPRTDSIDVVVRMRGSRSFQAQAAKNARALEAMGVAGSKSLPTVANASKKLSSAGASITRGWTLPVLGAAAVAGKLAYDFDASMRNVNSIAQLPERQLQALEGQVLDLAGPTAQAPKTLADSLYDLVSSGFDAKDSMTILKSSAKAATAGLTDAATSTHAIAAVLNAYHQPASQAAKISDILFRTVDRGVITFEELSSNIGDVLPFASSLGVGLDEVGASVATMTKAGISAPETMTRIKNVMVALLKPSEDLKSTIHDLGYESGETMIKQLGFQGTLDALAKTTHGSKEEMAKLFPNIRGLGGALALTGDNAAGAHEDLRGMENAVGATDRALGQQKQSVAYKFHQLSAELQAIAIKSAPPVLDALTSLMGIVAALAGAFSDLPPGLQQTLIQFLLISAAIGPLIWLGGKLLGGWVLMFGGIAKLLWFLERLRQAYIAGRIIAGGMAIENAGLAASFFALDLSVLAIPIAVAAVLAGLVILYLKVKWFRDKVNAVINFFKEHPLAAALIPMIGPFIAFAIIVANHFGDIKEAAQTAFSAIKGFFDKYLIKPMEWLIDKLQWFIDKVENIRLPWEDQQISAHGAKGGGLLTGPGSNPFGGLQGPAGPMGHVPRGASGFSDFPGGLAVVGERGPELAQLPKGTNLYSHLESRGILAALGGGSKTIVVPVNLDGKKIAQVVAKHADTAKARR